VNPVV